MRELRKWTQDVCWSKIFTVKWLKWCEFMRLFYSHCHSDSTFCAKCVRIFLGHMKSNKLILFLFLLRFLLFVMCLCVWMFGAWRCPLKCSHKIVKNKNHHHFKDGTLNCYLMHVHDWIGSRFSLWNVKMETFLMCSGRSAENRIPPTILRWVCLFGSVQFGFCMCLSRKS